MTGPASVLIVDDRKENLLAMEALLGELPDLRIVRAASGNEALWHTLEEDFALALLDVQMPGMDGFETATLMRRNPKTRDLPIIFVTAINRDQQHFRQGYEAGAVDYILKPIEPDVLRSKVRVFCDMYRQKLRERESTAWLTTTLNSIGDGVIATDEAGRVSFINPVAASLTGWDADEAIGRPLGEVFALATERGRLPVEAPVRRALQSGRTEAIVGPTLMLRRGGGETFVEVKASPLKADHGTRGAAVLVFSDVGTLRRAHRAADEATRTLERILHAVADGICGIDAGGTITFANPAAVRILGWSEQELHGRLAHALFHHHRPDGSDYPQESCPVAVSLRDGQPRGSGAGEFFWRKDGTAFPVEYFTAPIAEDDRIVGAVLTFRDTTKAQQAAEEREKMRDQLLQAQKMEAVGTLAGGIAHDFNNILTAINGYSSLLSMSLPPGGKAAEYVEQILASSDRAADLTRSLLAFSRKQVTEMKPVDINEILRGVQKMLARLIGEDIELHVRCAADPLTALADRGQIEQVLMNLAANARDAMPSGGSLQIAAERTALEVATADVPAGSYALVVVSDTGGGMDRHTLEHLFEPFFTTKGLGKGTGLGLSIVYGIVAAHHGSIHVYSEPGAGTVFRILLPLIHDATVATQAGPEPPLPTGSETILLVEDDASIREVTRLILEEVGYTVIEADGCDAAVARLREHRESVQLVLSDLIMPKKNGRETYEDLKAVKPDLKAIFMSGYTADLIEKRGILEGGVSFIPKPMHPSVLLRKIREVLES